MNRLNNSNKIDEDIEKIFNDEIRIKKSAATGVHSKTGTRGFVGSVRMPYEMLSGKEKRLYMGNTPKKSMGRFNMYELPSWQEYKKLSIPDKKSRMELWRKTFTIGEIADKFGIKYNILYAYCLKNKIPLKGIRAKMGTSNQQKSDSTRNTDSNKLNREDSFVMGIIGGSVELSFDAVPSKDELVSKLRLFADIIDSLPEQYLGVDLRIKSLKGE